MSKELDSVVRKSTSTKPTCDVKTLGKENAAKSGTGAKLNTDLISGDKANSGGAGKISDQSKKGSGGTLEFGSLKKKAADKSIYT